MRTQYFIKHLRNMVEMIQLQLAQYQILQLLLKGKIILNGVGQTHLTLTLITQWST